MTSLFEAEALAAIHRVAGLATATGNALTEASNALAAADRDDLRRQVEKVAELHRLLGSRLAGILRQLGEGA